jgi:hypothetical protein
MTIQKIYENILDSIKRATQMAIYNKTGEVRIVFDSVEEIRKLEFGSNVEIQVGFCHQKPYAFLISPDNLFTKQKTELGDFLFVIKYIDNNRIIDKRAMFFQAKYNNKENRFSIELHQFHFYRQIHNIEFRFGNSVYKVNENINLIPIIWKNISESNQFGDYILLGKDFVIDISINEIATQYEHKKGGSFNYYLKLLCDYCHFLTLNPVICCNNNRPLLDFLTPFGKGNKIQGQFEQFINLIYKRLGMIPDPPDENEGFWEEGNKSGFGLIEITISNND